MSSSSSSRRFDVLSWTKASEASSREGSTLVWPFGACEQHGPHLPLITDTYFAKSILVSVLELLPKDLPIWMLPPQSIGFSPEHASFKGTISLSADLMLQLITEVGEQISAMGFRRLVLFNAHGGQIGLLQAVARQLRVRCPSMAVLPCFLWSGVNSLKDLIPDKEVEEGLHAALAETSLMLHLNSQLVGQERPIDGIVQEKSDKNILMAPKGWSLEGAAPCAWLTKDLSNSGVIGNSTESNADLGEKIEKALVEHWVGLFSSLMESEWPPIK
ncbi:creatininase family protein [Prochlorococcus sp. MIT 1223]|uniref:creatininase family protein n=1 Tax=Prochlorococcus sp. MIT 1223 TaxID=3096217 RepID=UPI002A749C40|nr:creatininase family protein [Prochlorococcus sp. MIT 1223]